jgi:hypothetical protein
MKNLLDGKINFSNKFSKNEVRGNFKTIQPDTMGGSVKIGPGHLQTISLHNSSVGRYGGNFTLQNADYNALANSTF